MQHTWGSSESATALSWDPSCTLRIAVLEGEDVTEHFGRLRIISPDEVRDSFLLKLAERLGSEANEEESGSSYKGVRDLGGYIKL